MPSCEDCLSCEICIFHIKGDEYKKCPDFKNKADFVKVKYGHIISQEEAMALDKYELAFCCSVCGECNWDCTESESFNFCPNCGAKMVKRSESDVK